MSLSKLIAMQAAAKKPDSGDSPSPPVDGTAVRESESETANAPAESAPAPTPKKLPFANLNKSTPKPEPTPAPKPAEKSKDPLSLDNLGSFDLSDVDEPEAATDEFVGFVDEIEATAPDRELPEDLSPEMAGFVESLDSMYLVLNDSDMFAQSIRQIMMELQENPEYEKLVSDQDVHVMIRAMRNTMGLAKIRKQAKSRKTGTTKARAPSKKQALLDKALSLSIGMDVG